jgi:hypothetical protein
VEEQSSREERKGSPPVLDNITPLLRLVLKHLLSSGGKGMSDLCDLFLDCDLCVGQRVVRWPIVKV